LRVFCTLLKIKQRVVVVDINQWAELYEDISKKEKRMKFLRSVQDTFGMAMPEDRVIWLNPRFCKREYNVLCATIIHELLHVKYPNAKEDKILELERKYVGRYDYKRVNWKTEQGMRKCQRTQKQ
jgi:predicted metal-dependent hydrolase